MKHTIKFRKAILDIAQQELGYYTLSDNSIYKMLFAAADIRTGISIRKIKLRERYSDLRSKIIVYCDSDLSWNAFVREFLDIFSNMNGVFSPCKFLNNLGFEIGLK